MHLIMILLNSLYFFNNLWLNQKIFFNYNNIFSALQIPEINLIFFFLKKKYLKRSLYEFFLF